MAHLPSTNVFDSLYRKTLFRIQVRQLSETIKKFSTTKGISYPFETDKLVNLTLKKGKSIETQATQILAKLDAVKVKLRLQNKV